MVDPFVAARWMLFFLLVSELRGYSWINERWGRVERNQNQIKTSCEVFWIYFNVAERDPKITNGLFFLPYLFSIADPLSYLHFRTIIFAWNGEFEGRKFYPKKYRMRFIQKKTKKRKKKEKWRIADKIDRPNECFSATHTQNKKHTNTHSFFIFLLGYYPLLITVSTTKHLV